MNPYRLITGRHIDLSKLNANERKFLSEINARYQEEPAWTKFASFWTTKFLEAQLDESSPVYRLCQDLEARLGIAQGKVALPGYRDYLADLIAERYGTRYKFCKEAGVDQGQLSRVLAGRSELSIQFLDKILSKLDATLTIKPRDEVRAEVEPARARVVLSAITEARRHSRASA